MLCQCLDLFSGRISEEGDARLGQIEIIPQARNFERPRLGFHFLLYCSHIKFHVSSLCHFLEQPRRSQITDGMHYYIDDASVYCPCIGPADNRAFHPVSKMRFCGTCGIKRCFFCTLHSASNKSCLRCERKYTTRETHCYRCYTCPICDDDLESHPLLYKHKAGSSEVEFELIKSKDDKSKIAGKAVLFKCPNSDCRFKFTTKVETKPQSLQQIVQNNINDDIDVRYNELMDYYDWCLNFQRILDKRQRSKWKTEILRRFKSFEIANILQNDSHLQQLIDEESESIRYIKNVENNQLFPHPKVLNTKMQEICFTCLENISDKKMVLELPMVYAIPMVGYPSSNVKGLQAGESVDVPILISFVNDSGSSINLSIIENGVDVFLASSSAHNMYIPAIDESTKVKSRELATVPTCLLSHISKKGDWKTELAGRDPALLARLRYVEGLNFDGLEDTIDFGVNWITSLILVRVTGNETSCKGKINFVLNISVEKGETVSNEEYHCCALI